MSNICTREEITPQWPIECITSKKIGIFHNLYDMQSQLIWKLDYLKINLVMGWGGIIYKSCVKISKICQNMYKMSKCVKDIWIFKNMSNVKKTNSWTGEEVHIKNNLTQRIQTSSGQFWCHIWRSSKLVKNTFWGFWPLAVWIFDAWHLYDDMTTVTF